MAKTLTELDRTSTESVKRHTDPGDKSIVLPVGIPHRDAIKALERDLEAMETYVKTSPRYFPYLEDDGLVAAAHVLREDFGVAFSSGSAFNPPESKAVKVSLTESVEVPTGKVSIPSLGDDAVVLLGSGVDPQRPHLGRVFTVMAYVKRMDQPHITRFLDRVEERLATHSIYRHQAVSLTSGGALDFVDVSKYADPNRIVFNKPVQDAIDRYVLGPLRHRDRLKARGISQKRTTLGWGPFGTGKSTLGMIAARVAVETGHTFVQGGPAVDMNELMRVGHLYGPSQVFVEDIDNVANVSDADSVSALLEAFDGITAKGADVKLLMTTNYKDRIHPGMFRPGRIDNWLFIGPSDRETMERLIRVNINAAELAPDADFDALWDVIEGFTPSYIHEVLNKAIIGAVVVAESDEIVVTTDDLLAAADTVKAQWTLQQEATEPAKPPTLDQAFRALQVDAAHQVATSQEQQLLLLQAASAGVQGNLGQINRATREAIEEGINSTALYDKYGDDKKGQLVVE